MPTLAAPPAIVTPLNKQSPPAPDVVASSAPPDPPVPPNTPLDCCNIACQFEPAATECRASAGDCDIIDYCTGTSAACSTDAKSTALCRAKADICDVADMNEMLDLKASLK